MYFVYNLILLYIIQHTNILAEYKVVNFIFIVLIPNNDNLYRISHICVYNSYQYKFVLCLPCIISNLHSLCYFYHSIYPKISERKRIYRLREASRNSARCSIVLFNAMFSRCALNSAIRNDRKNREPAGSSSFKETDKSVVKTKGSLLASNGRA